jgi:hypothetical protein
MVDEIRSRGVTSILKTHGSPFQQAGWPDLLFSFAGIPVAIEAKQPGKSPTRLQQTVHAKMRKDGWIVLVLSSRESLRDRLNDLVQYCDMR